jgi:hypothetical protein
LFSLFKVDKLMCIEKTKVTTARACEKRTGHGSERVLFFVQMLELGTHGQSRTGKRYCGSEREKNERHERRWERKQRQSECEKQVIAV